MAYETNLVGFISREEHNLLTTMLNHRVDVDQFSVVDGHFQAPVKHLSVPATDQHGQIMLGLYLSFATLMRCHLSDSLASTRKAIDATLSAYRLHVEPGTLPEYLEAGSSYRFIKKTIEKARKVDEIAYPLAPPLLELHGTCSAYGSHADIASFAHRIKVVPNGLGSALMEHSMFQYPEDPEEFRYYLAATLSAYSLMLGVLLAPVGKYASGFEVEAWGDASAALTASIEKVRLALAKAGVEKKAAAQAAT